MSLLSHIRPAAAAGELTELAAAVLSDMAGAPPADLSRLLDRDGVARAGSGRAAGAGAGTAAGAGVGRATGPEGAGGERDPRSIVRRFATGIGTAATRFPPLPTPAPTAAEPTAGATGEPAGTDDDGMPELFCPGPLRDDPALGEKVNDGVVEWAEQVGIYPGALDRLRACNFGRLIMLAHPGTDDPDRLLAATKCVVVEWAADDYYVDEVSLGADPRIVGSRLATLYAIVDPASLPGRYASQLDEYREQEAIATAFRSAMEHLTRYTTASQLGRFQHQMGILFTAWSQEADWHRNGYTPAVWEYLVQRHLNSYLPPMILIDPVAGYELPAEEFYQPAVRRAFTLAGDANVLLNDLYSADFESDTDFNLPRVIAAEENCTPRQAIRRTVEIHNELMEMFVAEAAALSLVGSPALRRFLADTWCWLGGSREWHSTSARYHATPDQKEASP